jgi:hypothetical protein
MPPRLHRCRRAARSPASAPSRYRCAFRPRTALVDVLALSLAVLQPPPPSLGATAGSVGLSGRRRYSARRRDAPAGSPAPCRSAACGPAGSARRPALAPCPSLASRLPDCSTSGSPRRAATDVSRISQPASSTAHHTRWKVREPPKASRCAPGFATRSRSAQVSACMATSPPSHFMPMNPVPMRERAVWRVHVERRHAAAALLAGGQVVGRIGDDGIHRGVGQLGQLLAHVALEEPSAQERYTQPW